MKIQKTDYNGEPIDFDDRKRYEQKMLMLIGGVNGNYKTDYMGMERALSVRLNCLTYPKVKALSNLSGNSMNLVINDLIEVAYGVMIENMSDSDSDKLYAEERRVTKDWMDEYKPVGGE